MNDPADDETAIAESALAMSVSFMGGGSGWFEELSNRVPSAHFRALPTASCDLRHGGHQPVGVRNAAEFRGSQRGLGFGCHTPPFRSWRELKPKWPVTAVSMVQEEHSSPPGVRPYPG
jgi:hypothetical protein